MRLITKVKPAESCLAWGIQHCAQCARLRHFLVRRYSGSTARVKSLGTHVGLNRYYPDSIDDITLYVTKGIASNTLKELQEYAQKVKHVVDKIPHNFENIGLIKFFPNAKTIYVRRDPRDIVMPNYFTDYQAKYGGMGSAYNLKDIGKN